MSDVAWDAEDFEPEVPDTKPNVVSDKWEGEDDEDTKNDWEDEDQEESDVNVVRAIQVPKRKSLNQRLAEKGKKTADPVAGDSAAKNERVQSAAEAAIEKLAKQRLQEEADLKIAMETFGVNKDEANRDLSTFIPITADDFTKFNELLRVKISPFEKSGHYATFLDVLFRDLCLDLEPEDIKKLASTLNTVANEKAKVSKALKAKKKKKTPTLKMEKNELDDLEGGYNEYDDFI